MKKSIFTKMGAAAMVLTLVTASLVGGTFAKYTSTVSGTATATAAKWDVKFTKNDANKTTMENATINLTPKVTTGKAENTIVPGDTGEFDIVIDGSNTEVDFNYSIYLTAAEGNTLTGITFFSDADMKNEITDSAPLTETSTIAFDAADKTITKTIYWQLASDGVDSNDTLLAGKTATYTITMSATQVTPEPAS